MMHINEFCNQTGAARRSIERQISAGKLQAYKVRGKTFIIPDTEHPEVSFAEKDFTAQKRQQFDTMILTAGKRIARTPANTKAIRAELIKSITAEISALKAKGINISGYDKKSIYRKLQTGTVKRKTRADWNTHKHPHLRNPETLKKIYNTAVCVYHECAVSNFSLLTDLILMRAQQEEHLYEIASIPRSTLYNYFRRQFEEKGYKTLHQYLNHHNVWRKLFLPRVTGAFTEGVSYFDYIIGDDHKLDVSGVLFWDDAKRDYVQKQVSIWLWCEAQTMYPLGWEIRVGEFTAQDLKASITRVLMQYGMPNKAIVVDNGIGRASGFNNCLLYLGLGAEQIYFSKEYTPTNKAPGERQFAFVKEELDVFMNNFVSPDKERDSRHREMKLSPEETLETLSSYKKKLESFLTGFYISRIRSRRQPGGKVKKISIAEYFDTGYTHHLKIEADRKLLKQALGAEKDVVFSGDVRLGRDTFITVQEFPIAFYGKKFRLLYNPADMAEVDMYALSDMLDTTTGEEITKGSFICTLYNTRMHPERGELVRQAKKRIEKAFKEAARNVAMLREQNQNELEATMPWRVTASGDMINERKAVEREIAEELKQTVEKIIIEDTPVKAISTDTEGEALTRETREMALDTGGDGYSLTPDDEDDDAEGGI